jgi:hypothetical protein
MKIAHVTTFGPNGCGLYEASRNMMKADSLSGHEVFCIDTGIKPDNTYHEPQVGVLDNRGEWSITTSHHSILDKMDLIIMHTYCKENWYCRNQVPLLWVVHGRPAAAFRQELNDPKYLAYSAYGNISFWPRVKKVVHFWPEYEVYYDVVCKPNSQYIIDFPAIDTDRFIPNGNKFDLTIGGDKKDYIGEINGLICDPRRDDIDRFDVMVGALYAAKQIKGLKWHFVGLDTPIKQAEQRILAEIEKIGALGVRIGRIHTIEDIYRACDFLYTPHSIITQTVGEAVSCGLKVIAHTGNKLASQTINVYNPVELVNAIDNLDKYKNKIIPTLKEFGSKMNKVYAEIIK